MSIQQHPQAPRPPENKGWENGYPPRPPSIRRKSGLETPLLARLDREGSRLVVAPPKWYDMLICGTFALGLYCIISPYWRGPSYVGDVFSLAGWAMLLAGVLALLSNERLIVMLRSGQYRRIEGTGFRVRLVNGHIRELDAVVATKEPYGGLTGVTKLTGGGDVPCIYRLTLHWKGRAHPPLVLHRLEGVLPTRGGPNPHADFVRGFGADLAQKLQVGWYDNLYLNQGSPVPLV